MRWLFLVAAIFCALMSLLFIDVSLYALVNYHPVWRVAAMIPVVALWTMLTYKAFLRFKTSTLQ
jgi:hypothetical protein